MFIVYIIFTYFVIDGRRSGVPGILMLLNDAIYFLNIYLSRFNAYVVLNPGDCNTLIALVLPFYMQKMELDCTA